METIQKPNFYFLLAFKELVMLVILLSQLGGIEKLHIELP